MIVFWSWWVIAFFRKNYYLNPLDSSGYNRHKSQCSFMVMLSDLKSQSPPPNNLLPHKYLQVAHNLIHSFNIMLGTRISTILQSQM